MLCWPEGRERDRDREGLLERERELIQILRKMNDKNLNQSRRGGPAVCSEIASARPDPRRELLI
jgi:hypothetical protein